MNKVLGHLGHIEVDDVRHVGHVDTAGGNVGGNEHAMTALGEAAQSLIALGLRAVAVNLRGGMAAANEATSYAVCAVLGAHENQKASLLCAKKVLEQLLFFVCLDFEGAQLDVIGGLEHRADFDAGGGVEGLARHIDRKS